VFANQQNGYGTLAFAFAEIQNGAPDGVALVNAANQLQQFISYEGAFTASNGVAIGRMSEDISIAESSATEIGSSLQLTGNSSMGFKWQVADRSFGAINAGQKFSALSLTQGSVAVAPSGLLLILGLLSIAVNGSAKRKGRQAVTV